MRLRRILPIVLVAAAAAACDSIAESPTEAPSLAKASSDNNEDPPPPPVDTGDITVDGSTGGGFNFNSVSARYFANKPGNNAWNQFYSGQFVIASPGARLQYHQNSGRTNGNGILTDTRTGATLDLSTVRIVAGRFGACDGSVRPEVGGAQCGQASFTASGGPGFLVVAKRSTEVVVVD